MRGDGSELIPATPREGFTRMFAWYTRRLLRKRFHRVHATPETLTLLADVNRFAGPAVMCCTHGSWWDPLVALHFQRDYLGSRSHYSPIDRTQLQRFKFFRKVGLFGIDPDSPASLDAMTGYIDGLRQAHPRLTLGITPQGRFTDPREAIRLRPGAAAIAARLPGVRVVAAAVEYAGWQDSRPSIFVHAQEVPAPELPSTAAWHRVLQAGMQQAANELALLVIARDPAPFSIVLGPHAGTSTEVNPVHGLWLRIRGRSGEISSARSESRTADSQRCATQPVTAAGGGGR